MELSDRQINEIVYKLRVALRQDLKKMLDENRQPEMVTTKEAAAILGITPGRLRQIVSLDPYRFPHIKKGNGEKQGQLLFERNALLQ